MAKAPSGTPSALRLCISEIFSSSGQPARVTPNGLLLIAAVLLLQALGAGILSLVVAEDAVMRLIEAAAQIHAGIGQGKAFAPADMARRRLERRRAVVIHLIEMHQMLRDPPFAAP